MIRLRTFTSAITVLIALLSTGSQLLAADPIHLVPGAQLFVDDYLIEQSICLVRTTHQPEKLDEPILPKAEVWHQQPLFFHTVLRDPVTGQFRMWYNVKNPGFSPGVAYAYAVSNDGIHWTRPNLGIVSAGGSTNNNLIEAPFNHFGLAFFDEGPDYQDPSRRYKMAYFDNGLSVAYSSDGFHFTTDPANPVIQDDIDGVSVISDVIDGVWDPLGNRYLIPAKREDTGYPGDPHYAPPGTRRTVTVTSTTDFENWVTPHQIITPDPNNGIEEFYGMKPIVRGNLYLGFLRVLRDDLPADPGGAVEGIGWTELATSRDGETWTRYQETFVDRNTTAGAWDHAMAWVGDVVTVGDKDYVYYGGYSEGHKIGDRQIGMGILRKDGFVSRDAGSGEASLRTPLVTFHGAAVNINANVQGELRARVLDENNNPVPGFDWGDFKSITGDSVDHPAVWTGDMDDIEDIAVHLEFAFTNTEFYSFNIVEKSDLLMQINRSTGAIALVNQSDHALNLDLYQILSAAGSLDPNGWSSLASQGFDGTPENTTWVELGTTDSELSEGNFEGSSVLAAGASLSLGTAYDEVRDSRDISLKYLSASNGPLIEGNVQYLSQSVGDMNGNGTVGVEDIALFVMALTDRVRYSAMYPTLNVDAIGDVNNDGTFDFGDLNAFSVLFNSSTTSGATVPEPSTIELLLLTLTTAGHSGCCCRRNCK